MHTQLSPPRHFAHIGWQTESLKVAVATKKQLDLDCAAMEAKTEEALKQSRASHEPEMTKLQNACKVREMK